MIRPVHSFKISRAELIEIIRGTKFEPLISKTDKSIDVIHIGPEFLSLIKEYLLLGDALRIHAPANYEGLLKNATEGCVWVFPFETREDEDYVELSLQDTWFSKDPDDCIRKHDAVAIDFGTKSTVVAISHG